MDPVHRPTGAFTIHIHSSSGHREGHYISRSEHEKVFILLHYSCDSTVVETSLGVIGGEEDRVRLFADITQHPLNNSFTHHPGGFKQDPNKVI